MLPRIAEFLHTVPALQPDRLLLLGVSGGPDSLCMLDGLLRLGVPLAVAHLDHALRPESAQEAQTVREIALRYGVPLVSERQPAAAFAQAEGRSIEEAARILRYRFLFRQAERLDAQGVCVGHTADDQVETVLMHLLRGAGLAGLKGMLAYSLPNAWSESIPLLRPLLGVWRAEVLAYCQENGLQPLFDRSNLDTTFFRNRLRHELLPALEALSPGLRRRVWNMAASLAGDEAVLEALTQAAWERAAIPGGEACLGFDRRQWLSEPLAIRRRLVRKAAARLRPGLRDLDFALAQAAVDFFSTAGGAAQRDFLAGLRLLREGESLWLAGWEADLPAAAGPQLPAGLAQPLALPGQIGLAAGWRLMAAWISDPAEAARLAADNPDPYQAWLDPGPDVEPLLVRGRLPGERFQPLGLDGRSQNLADFMINVKLPNRLRAAWPLVCRSGQILWVPGYRLAHPARLTSESRRALHLRLERDPQAA